MKRVRRVLAVVLCALSPLPMSAGSRDITAPLPDTRGLYAIVLDPPFGSADGLAAQAALTLPARAHVTLVV